MPPLGLGNQTQFSKVTCSLPAPAWGPLKSACHLNEETLTLGVVSSWGPGGLFQRWCLGSLGFQARSSLVLASGGPHPAAWLRQGAGVQVTPVPLAGPDSGGTAIVMCVLTVARVGGLCPHSLREGAGSPWAQPEKSSEIRCPLPMLPAHRKLAGVRGQGGSLKNMNPGDSPGGPEV